jgi:hypothetical protein
MVTRPVRIGPAVAKAIRAAQLGDWDAAAVALAKHYAALVDDGDQAAGLRLLRVLDSLGLTPASRTARTARGEAPSGPVVHSKLDELRARRARRSG